MGSAARNAQSWSNLTAAGERSRRRAMETFQVAPAGVG